MINRLFLDAYEYWYDLPAAILRLGYSRNAYNAHPGNQPTSIPTSHPLHPTHRSYARQRIPQPLPFHKTSFHPSTARRYTTAHIVLIDFVQTKSHPLSVQETGASSSPRANYFPRTIAGTMSTSLPASLTAIPTQIPPPHQQPSSFYRVRLPHSSSQA